MRSLSAKTAATSLLAILWAATIALNWPGHLSNDSVIELLEGRAARYESWHPAITSWLLGFADFLHRGTGLFIAFDITLLYAALLLLVRMRERTSWLALVAIVLAAATPQFVLYPALVWKDVLFAEATVAGFACLAFAAARWQRPQQRFAFILLSILLLTLAALTRQNGIVSSLMAAPAYAFVARKNAVPLRASLVQALVFLIALIATFALATTALNQRGDGGKGRADEIKMLQLYDFTAAAANAPQLRFDDLEQGAPTFDRLIRTDGARLYTPERVDTLQKSQRLSDARDDTPLWLTTTQWRHLIAQHSLLYLKNRAEIFRWAFLTPDIEACVPFLVGVSGPPATLRALDMPARYDNRDAALETYAQNFVGTPIFSHAFFAVLGLAAAIILLRRWSPSDIAIVFLLAAAGMFTLTFFAISLACDYRYLYLLDMAAIIGALHAILGANTDRKFARRS
ncbi:MAG TPA: hypothetical protein VMS78_00190 [Rhizomicrobium sp.]|nr:hypothetical protein [Rhizomicrobium sp.]